MTARNTLTLTASRFFSTRFFFCTFPLFLPLKFTVAVAVEAVDFAFPRLRYLQLPSATAGARSLVDGDEGKSFCGGESEGCLERRGRDVFEGLGAGMRENIGK
uniref:Uncharacterized protein n=1 Tax=Trypanosoma congolense (strain IL3000) TaxID=1068625 RepID=G0US51_TRYCI|nr:hypothetical protein, unlikely [Trypanosoma congolense IL3000]